MIGDVAGLGPVWYNPSSMANILSMAQVRKKCCITMNTAIEPALLVHCSTGKVMKFMEFTNGLYYFDAESKITVPTNGYVFVQTIAQNQARYHRRKIAGADCAVALLRKIGRPSQKEFETILSNNLIRNCPITVDDARRAIVIYGPDRATLQGKTVKKSGANTAVPTHSPVELPSALLEDHNDITPALDFFFVQGMAFLHTISRKLKFCTISPVKSRSKAMMLHEVLGVVKLYQSRGLSVVDIHADMEFKCIENDMIPVRLNLTAHDDHVGEAERSIRTVKERVRADVHGLPFKRLPKVIVLELLRQTITVLNQFPALDGISATLSPLTIMTGRPIPDYNTMKVEFGSYAHVFEDNKPTNSYKARSTGAIALNPTGNDQGDVNFLSLTTWKVLLRAQWTVLPMPDAAIAAVEKHAGEEGQPLIAGGCPLFEWQPDAPIQVADNDVSEDEEDDDDDDDDEGDEGFGGDFAPDTDVDDQGQEDGPKHRKAATPKKTTRKRKATTPKKKTMTQKRHVATTPKK